MTLQQLRSWRRSIGIRKLQMYLVNVQLGWIPKRKETPTEMIIHRVETRKRACPQVPNALDRFTQSKEIQTHLFSEKSNPYSKWEIIRKDVVHSKLFVPLSALESSHTNRPSSGHSNSIESTRGRHGWRGPGHAPCSSVAPRIQRPFCHWGPKYLGRPWAQSAGADNMWHPGVLSKKTPISKTEHGMPHPCSLMSHQIE